MKIALCDDRPEDLASLSGLMEEYRRERPELALTVHPFASASGVLDAPAGFDIYLLDILMPGLDGIELGRELRLRDTAAPILYLTVSRDFALESYRAEAMAYLVKPVGRAELFRALDRAAEQCAMDRARALLVQTDGGVRRVFYHELLSAEAEGRVLLLRLGGRTLAASGRKLTFGGLWDSLRRDGRFLLVRRGLLVNMDHVTFLGERELELSDGLRVPVPPRRRAEVRRAYWTYCHEQFSADGGAT